jgi:hypothetical protein
VNLLKLSGDGLGDTLLLDLAAFVGINYERSLLLSIGKILDLILGALDVRLWCG